MSDQLFWSIVAIVAIPLAGWPWARVLGLRGALLAAAAWLLGCALLTMMMLLLSAVNGRFSRASLALIWLVLVAAGLLIGRTKVKGGSESRPLPGDRLQLPLAALALVVVFVQVMYVWLAAVRVPLGSFDSWSLWEYKGRRFWLDGMISGGVLRDHSLIFAHPAYPPLLSLLITWVYTWAGAAEPSLMKPLFPLFFCALLCGFYAAVRARLGVSMALLALGALALLPRMADYAGAGLADVPMTAFLVGSAAAYCAYRESSDRRAWIAAGLFLGMAALIKRDALPYLGAGILTIALVERQWKRVLWFAGPAIAVCAPWYLYARLGGLQDRDFLPFTLTNLGAHLDRLGPIARLFILNLFATDEWSILWYVVLAALVLAIPRKTIKGPALLLLILLPLAGFVGSLSLSAWPDYTLHVRTSLDRLLLGAAPFALWFVCEQLAPRGARRA